MYNLKVRCSVCKKRKECTKGLKVDEECENFELLITETQKEIIWRLEK